MKTPLIFDIKRSSTKDGPGIRTVVFFKGCNLDCYWCHNPEGKAPEAQMAFFKEKCVSCGNCLSVCKNAKSECNLCGKCSELCPAMARKLYGKAYTADEIFNIIKADKAYFDATGGGVTFSGGECMLYPEFIKNLSLLCKESGIRVAIDTAGCVPYSHFETILPYVDLFLYDIKALTPQIHKNGTSKDNTLILQNLDRLIKTDKKIIVRVPVIPNFNDGAELKKITEFCKSLNLTYELLPYHTFGTDKKEALQSFQH